jgi:ubiquinone/menaquinone biosynthesis C-methylase UbiE
MKKEIIVDIAELDRYLDKVNIIFPIQNLIQSKIDLKKIKRYYRDSYSGYKYLHSKEGAVHMALNYNGTFDDDGFYAQANEISNIIESSEIKNVLELGCGKGFNSIYLAKKHPNVKFIGIDITDEHLLTANSKAQDIANLEFSYGDFHDLDFHDSSFDLIFELESICHASNMRKVLSEIYRILKPSGQFVLYEGFKEEGFENLSESLKKAAILTEKSMAVNNFEKIDDWLKIASDTGFKVKVISELSEAIMPNLGRFQVWARGYYKYPFLSRIFLKILPKDMVMNSIAGLLMPFTVHNNAHGYYKIILEEKEPR